MAEDDTHNRADEDDKAPHVAVPSHDPLPPPPEISFTRPTLGQTGQSNTGNTGRAAPSPGGQAGSKNSAPFNLGTGMSAGITLASSVVVGFLIGQWIDHHWQLSLPWGTIIFSLTGVAAGFINLFRILSVTDDTRRK